MYFCHLYPLEVLFLFTARLLSSILQAALLLKSQGLAIRQDDLIMDQDVDITELIGETLNLDRYVSWAVAHSVVAYPCFCSIK
jgi:hypothetical protein